MDGWNEFTHVFGDQSDRIPPPQSRGYMNESNYGYNFQMHQDSSQYYNQGRNGEWQQAYNANTLHPYQAYTYSPPNPNTNTSPPFQNYALLELYRRCAQGGDEGQNPQSSFLQNESSEVITPATLELTRQIRMMNQGAYGQVLPSSSLGGSQNVQGMSIPSLMEQEEWRMPTNQVGDASFMGVDDFQGNFLNNYEGSFHVNYPPIQGWNFDNQEGGDFQQVEDEKSSLEVLIEIMIANLEEDKKRDEASFEEWKKRNEATKKRLEDLENQVSQIVSALTDFQQVEEFEEESKVEEELEEEKNLGDEESNEVFEELSETNDVEENEQSQEANDDELKSEMSISKPLNSLSCFELDNIVYIDFVLPIDFSHILRNKIELEEMLGVYLERRNKSCSRMERARECKLKRVEFLKPCSKDATEVVTCHKYLVEEEAQRLKFDGKDERYPWPFR